MVTCFNADIYKEITETLNLKNGVFFDNEMQNKVIPVLEVNKPYARYSQTASTSASGATGVLILPSDKDVIVTGITFSFIKDAACDIANGTITVNGVNKGFVIYLSTVSVLTLTAQADTIVVPLLAPMKLDRGSTITVTKGAHTAGNLLCSVTVTGYSFDTLRNL